MNSSYDQELLNCFLDEARDTLTAWERACLDLEVSGATGDRLNALFRAAHNLKGASRAVGLLDVGELIHATEDVIQLLIKGDIQVSPEILQLLLLAQGKFNDWFEGLRVEVGYRPDFDPLPALLSKYLQPGHGHHLEKFGTVGSMASGAPSGSASQMTQNSSQEEDLEALFARTKEEFEGSSKAQVLPQVGQVRPTTPALTEQNKVPEASLSAKGKSEESIRVAASKLDEIIQLIGELSIHQNIVAMSSKNGTTDSPTCANAIHFITKLTKELQSKSLSLRMQPVQGLFQRLERVARDVARAQDKKIQVEITGTEVELDKTVIERITDPLVHILRNAVDHGIENSAMRVASGKKESAMVGLHADQEGSGVVIKITDDGQGLDPNKLRNKAIEKGLISPDLVLSNSEINNLIFLPGFSTAETVTDISGRGVGMDVVMRAVQELHGSIRIESQLGKGTSFLISLPTSVSIIDALIVRLEQERYAISIDDLTEIIDLAEYSVERQGRKGAMFDLRGSVVPVAPLTNFLRGRRLKDARASAEGVAKARATPALIVREGLALVAFEIDEIIGQQQVVIRPLSGNLKGLPGINGCTIFGDGEPGMIINLSGIARGYLRDISREGNYA